MISSGDLNRWVVDKQQAEIGDLNQNIKSLASKNKALFALVAAFVVLIGVGILTNRRKAYDSTRFFGSEQRPPKKGPAVRATGSLMSDRTKAQSVAHISDRR